MNKSELKVQYDGTIINRPADPCIIIIFGATGDLTRKDLVPSLYALDCKKFLTESFAIIGFARRNWGDDGFRDKMKDAVKHTSDCDEKQWNQFAKKLFYVRGEFEDNSNDSYNILQKKIQEIQKKFKIPDNVLFHLATPPEFYGTIVKNLDAASLSKSNRGWRRFIVEKPFGRDENSARMLDSSIQKVLNEDQVYRVDHYLGKETVQNMLVFRFANPGFEPIWNRNYIDNVQITVAEDRGIGTRGNFYESTGIVRDMVQNHLLQLLCITAIEPPVSYDSESLRTQTIEVLRSICKIDIVNDCVLGQYSSGEIKGENVPGYREEENVKKNSITPTYAAVKINLDNWRWADVPFYLRTGKRLAKKLTEVTISFKPTPHLMFPLHKHMGVEHNVLSFRLQPDEGIVYTFTAKHPGAELNLVPVDLDFRYDKAFGIEEPPSSYQWLLFDAMQGDQTLFPRADWIYKAWSIVDPIIQKWESEPWLKFPNYKAGSWGPAEADNLLNRENRKWKYK
jgi:glucose-6-phosphate 1-dehydrogenase